MTIREAYEIVMEELNQKQAPSISLEKFLHYWNKATLELVAERIGTKAFVGNEEDIFLSNLQRGFQFVDNTYETNAHFIGYVDNTHKRIKVDDLEGLTVGTRIVVGGDKAVITAVDTGLKILTLDKPIIVNTAIDGNDPT